jgi:RNA polymerase sigma-70 factor (ECF subfamily)
MEAEKLTFGNKEWQLAYRVALKVLRCPDRAEDAAQDALLQAYRARSGFEGKAKPESWLYRIAFNTALSHLRRPYTRRYSGADVFDVLESSAPQSTEGGSPLDIAVAAELAESMQTCMATMRPADQIAFTERFVLGTSEKELGSILGVSTNAAKQRAFRARRTLRSCLCSAQTPDSDA